MTDDAPEAVERWAPQRRTVAASLTAAKIVGSLLIAMLLYWSIFTVVFCVAGMLYAKGTIVDLPLIIQIQRELYVNGGWNVWQAQPGCVEFDEKLIYKPTIGPCRFTNLEFQTVLNFTPSGRLMDDVDRPADAIAVLGDSFAMGWGVDDADTFAAELQRRTGRKVYNLAVSSYGTARELLRLGDLDRLDTVDTVIIQYCDNDREENLRFAVPSLAEARRIYATATKPRRSDRWFMLKYYYRAYKATIWYPIVELSRRVFHHNDPEDFGPHYEVLTRVIRAADALQGKRVIIFYTRGYNVKFKNFPVGKDRTLDNVTFVDVTLGPKDFYVLDPHLNRVGHKAIGDQLAAVLDAPDAGDVRSPR